MWIDLPDIPSGFGLPLVNLATDLFPQPTMDALDARYASGIEEYANTTVLDSVAETALGTVSPDTSWGAYTGIAVLNDYAGSALVITIAGIRLGTASLTQFMELGRHNTGYSARVWRTKFGVAAWTAWSFASAVPTPTGNYDAATKAYVDAKGINIIAWAALDTLQSNQSRVGLVSVTGSDLGALTGIAKYNGWGGGELWFEQHGSYVTSNFYTSQLQRIWIPNADGSMDEIRRARDDDPGYIMSPWSAWTIVQSTYPTGEIEIGTSGAGVILRSPDGTRYRVTVANGGTLSVAPA